MNHSKCTTKYETRLTQPKRAAQPSNEIQSTKDYVRNYQRIMQNKPNFQDVQMNIYPYNTTAYEKFIPLAGYKNKPNLVRPALFAKELPDWSKPIKANCRKGKIDAKCVFTKDYRKKDDFLVRINKPNFRKAQNERKSLCHRALWE